MSQRLLEKQVQRVSFAALTRFISPHPPIFTPKKKGGWQIVVEGKENEAHIRCTGNAPLSVTKAVNAKEGSGFINTFDSLCHLAGLLTN